SLSAPPKFDAGDSPPALALVLREGRHTRDPAGPPQEGARPPVGPGMGLADAYSDERPHRAPAAAREARLRPGRPSGSASDPAGGEGGRDQPGVVHQDEPLSRGEGGTATELRRLGADASLRAAHSEGAEARAGCAGTASA